MTIERKLYPVLFILLIIGQTLSVHAQVKYDLVVAKDGSGDFISIQAAIDAAKAFPDKRVTIHIKNGLYEEKVTVHSWNRMLTLRGEDRDSTIIRNDDYFDRIDRGRNSTFHTSTMLVQASEFIAENLTIENTAGPVGQAIALSVIADKCIIRNCRITGNQDTLYLAGEGSRQLFEYCIIEGTTDFIFGEATALFWKCLIVPKANSYITAASTPQGAKYGFVFMHCTIEGGHKASEVYLGRPWRLHAQTVFLYCSMGEMIRPEGWHDWSKPEAQTSTFYAEYENKGEGFRPGKRVSWAHILTKKEAAEYSPGKILSGKNMMDSGWFGLNSEVYDQ